jgi:hypothetical protein
VNGRLDLDISLPFIAANSCSTHPLQHQWNNGGYPDPPPQHLSPGPTALFPVGCVLPLPSALTNQAWTGKMKRAGRDYSLRQSPTGRDEYRCSADEVHSARGGPRGGEGGGGDGRRVEGMQLKHITSQLNPHKRPDIACASDAPCSIGKAFVPMYAQCMCPYKRTAFLRPYTGA